MIKNLILHLHTINKHRWLVFKLCCKAGITFRGLVHDLSKYSPTEFWESVKYFQGSYSPIRNAKAIPKKYFFLFFQIINTMINLFSNIFTIFSKVQKKIVKIVLNLLISICFNFIN